jgi:hypothetical protein
LVLSQALTLFTTPVIYLYLDQFTCARRRERSSAHAHGAAPAAQGATTTLAPGVS